MDNFHIYIKKTNSIGQFSYLHKKNLCHGEDNEISLQMCIYGERLSGRFKFDKEIHNKILFFHLNGSSNFTKQESLKIIIDILVNCIYLKCVEAKWGESHTRRNLCKVGVGVSDVEVCIYIFRHLNCDSCISIKLKKYN